MIDNKVVDGSGKIAYKLKDIVAAELNDTEELSESGANKNRKVCKHA